jgi:hypothetical protein
LALTGNEAIGWVEMRPAGNYLLAMLDSRLTPIYLFLGQ